MGRPGRPELLAASALGGAHEVGAWVVVVGNAVTGVWALVAHRRPEARRAALWWFTIAVQTSIFVEVALGVAYQRDSGIEPTSLHLLYGFASLFGVGILYSYRTQLADRVYLLYGLGGLFLMGMGIRSMVLHT